MRNEQPTDDIGASRLVVVGHLIEALDNPISQPNLNYVFKFVSPHILLACGEKEGKSISEQCQLMGICRNFLGTPTNSHSSEREFTRLDAELFCQFLSLPFLEMS